MPVPAPRGWLDRQASCWSKEEAVMSASTSPATTPRPCRCAQHTAALLWRPAGDGSSGRLVGTPGAPSRLPRWRPPRRRSARWRPQGSWPAPLVAHTLVCRLSPSPCPLRPQRLAPRTFAQASAPRYDQYLASDYPEPRASDYPEQAPSASTKSLEGHATGMRRHPPPPPPPLAGAQRSHQRGAPKHVVWQSDLLDTERSLSA